MPTVAVSGPTFFTNLVVQYVVFLHACNEFYNL